MDSEILVSPKMPPETTCAGKSLVPRHVKCTVQKQTLCRDESWAMVPIWAPSAACPQYCRLCTDSAPRSHAAPTISEYTARAYIFQPLMNSHQGCLGVHLAGTHENAGKRRAVVLNKISADATRVTAPPPLH